MARIARAFRSKKSPGTEAKEAELRKNLTQKEIEKFEPESIRTEPEKKPEKKPEPKPAADPNDADVESALKRLEDSGQITPEQRKKMRAMTK